MKLILLEFIEEAKTLMNRYGKEFFFSKDTLVVSLHPKVRAYLKGVGIESRDTVKFFGNDAQHRIISKTEEIAARVFENINMEDDTGVHVGYEQFCLLHFRLYLLYFFRVIEILEGIKNEYSIEAVYCSRHNNPEQMYSNHFFITDDELFLGQIAQEFCRLHHIAFEPTSFSNKKKEGLKGIFASCVRLIGKVLAFADYRILGGDRAEGKKNIIVPALSYNMGSLLREIKSRHEDVYSVLIMEGNKTLRQELSKIKMILSHWGNKLRKRGVLDKLIILDLIQGGFKRRKDQESIINREFLKFDENITRKHKDMFEYNGIDVSQYVISKMDKGIKTAVKEIQHLTGVIYEIFKDLQPALLMAMYSRGIYCTMGELAQKMDFHSLNISHGTHVPPNNKFDEIENYHLGTGVILNPYRYVAVQTPWAEKFLDHYADTRPRIKSGPLLYSKKSSKQRQAYRKSLGVSEHTKIIVHATTLKRGRRGRLHITETLDEYIAALCDLINATNQHKGVHLVIRPHPVCDMSNEELTSLLPRCDKMTISRGEPFAIVLSAADLMISYSSTCIEEALQENIPVILFDKWGRYNHFNIPETKDAGSIQRAPVYYVTDQNVLAEGLKEILNKFENEPLKDEELSLYKYPDSYRNNFSKFIDDVLTEKIPSFEQKEKKKLSLEQVK